MPEKKVPETEKIQSAKADTGKAAQREPGAVELAFLSAVSVIAAIWNAATADGTLAAAARQGVDELGAALKAFPDSIQQAEHGTLFNPTQGEIAADRDHGGHASYWHSSVPRNQWPSEIAKENRNQAGNDNGYGRGHENGHDADAGHSM